MARLRLYMTPKEVAAYLGMSQKWIYRRIQLGGGPPFRRRGRMILFLATDVERWDRQQIGTARPRPRVRRRPQRGNSLETHVI